MNVSSRGTWSAGLSDTEYETLFTIAEDAISACVKSSPSPFDASGYELSESLRVPMATFVTLNLHGALRGCIGSLEPVAPLCESVHDNAVNASQRDPRFRPVREEELSQLDVHISLLSPIVPIDSIDEFILGEHGIIMEKDGSRAVYLPEVALEQGWSVEETLSSLSQKAGLPMSAWREGARFKVFSSVVLSR